MYQIDGEFGQVRSVRFPLDNAKTPPVQVPFHFNNAGWHRCNDLYRIRRGHGKDGHLLLFSLSEGGMLELANRPAIRLNAGSVAWVPPWQKHMYYTRPGMLWEFYWLDVEESPQLHFDDIFQARPVLPVSNMDRITQEIEGFLCGQNRSMQDSLVESSRMIGDIYHFLLQEALSHSCVGPRDEFVRRIIRQMETACERPWCLQDISKAHFVSVPQLIRRFKTETGKTPYAYLMALRLQTAETYLRYTKHSISEICRMTGFTSTSNFIQQFQKAYGTTPSRYRESK